MDSRFESDVRRIKIPANATNASTINVRSVLLDMKISKMPYSFTTLDILRCKILFINLFSTSLSHDLFGNKTQSFLI